jgi:hypothetical protein
MAARRGAAGSACCSTGRWNVSAGCRCGTRPLTAARLRMGAGRPPAGPHSAGEVGRRCWTRCHAACIRRRVTAARRRPAADPGTSASGDWGGMGVANRGPSQREPPGPACVRCGPWPGRDPDRSGGHLAAHGRPGSAARGLAQTTGRSLGPRGVSGGSHKAQPGCTSTGLGELGAGVSAGFARAGVAASGGTDAGREWRARGVILGRGRLTRLSTRSSSHGGATTHGTRYA